MKKLHILSVVIALTTISIKAQASIIDLNLTGTVSQAYIGSYDSGGTHYDYSVFSLNQFTPISVQLGDTINTTITFDQSITMPILGSGFGFFIRGDMFPNVNTATLGNILVSNDFSNSVFSNYPGTFVDDGWVGDTTMTGGLGTVRFFYPGAQPLDTFIFNSVYSSFTITDLSGNGPVTLNTAYFQTWLMSPVTTVPVPAAIWLFGSALVGFIGFNRRKSMQLAA